MAFARNVTTSLSPERHGAERNAAGRETFKSYVTGARESPSLAFWFLNNLLTQLQDFALQQQTVSSGACLGG